jgi:hypothetical protein
MSIAIRVKSLPNWHSRVPRVVVWAERALQRVCEQRVFGMRAVTAALNEKNAGAHFRPTAQMQTL